MKVTLPSEKLPTNEDTGVILEHSEKEDISGTDDSEHNYWKARNTSKFNRSTKKLERYGDLIMVVKNREWMKVYLWWIASVLKSNNYFRFWTEIPAVFGRFPLIGVAWNTLTDHCSMKYQAEKSSTLSLRANRPTKKKIMSSWDFINMSSMTRWTKCSTEDSPNRTLCTFASIVFVESGYDVRARADCLVPYKHYYHPKRGYSAIELPSAIKCRCSGSISICHLQETNW